MSDVERLWTHQETARYLHVSAWTLTELVRHKGGPTVFRVGRNRRYDPVDVTAWLRRNAINPDGAGSSVGRHVRTDLGEEDQARTPVGLGEGAGIESGPVAR